MKGNKAIILFVTLVLVISSMTTVLAEEKKITFYGLSDSVYVNISDVTSEKVIEFGNYTSPLYVSGANVKITFGSGFASESAHFAPDTDVTIGDEDTVKSEDIAFTEEITFDYKVEYDENTEEGYAEGNYLILKKPGLYLIQYHPPVLASEFFVVKVVADETDSTEEVTPVEETTTTPVAEEAPVVTTSEPQNANPTNSKVTVNGETVAFEAYNINDNNYFKLRDIAMALNGSEKQFEIGWDSDKNLINLTSNQPYTVAGGELVVSENSEATEAVVTSSKVQLDGKEIELIAYNIGGNNYFKLRDLGQYINFGVAWDAETKTIVVDSSKDYTK